MKDRFSGTLARWKVTVLAVVVAAVLVGAPAALAANGKPFVLGKRNVASAVSTLIKKGTGPALSLKVRVGQPPLSVNSGGKVANLNTDRLDGKDSTDFLGNTEKATDADRLDGQDSSAFVASGTYRLGQGQERAGEVLGDGSKVLRQSCLPGDRLLSGGPASVNVNSDVLDSFAPDTNTWQARINDSAVAGGDNFTVLVLCADQ